MNMFENLESRRMMSVTASLYSDGSLGVSGDQEKNEILIEMTKKDGSDHIRVKDHGNTVKIKLSGGQKVSSVPKSQVNEILVDGYENDDKLYASSSGASAVSKPIWWWGGEGNDTIRPGKGKDLVHGENGNDTVDYSKYSDDVEVHLGTDDPISGRIGSSTDRDRILEVENAKGGKGDDMIFGTYDDNKLWGGDGDDTINPGGGADKVYGEDGDDMFFVWEAFDKKDQIDGGDDHDRLVDKMLKDVDINVEQYAAAI